jgi:hypothetical protein
MSKLVNLAQGQTFKNDATAANQKGAMMSAGQKPMMLVNV